MQLTRLVGHVRGGHGVALGVADLHEFVMLQRLARDEVEVPRGRVVLGIVKTRGVGEVRVLAAKLRRALVHARDKGVDRAAERFTQNVARLVRRDDEHAVEQLLDRHRFAGDDVRRAAVAGEPLERRFRRSDGVGQRDLALVDGLKHQQRDHHLCERRGEVLLMGVFLIENFARVGLNEKAGLRVECEVLIGVSARERKEREQERKR